MWSISDAELERRWALARELMREREIDYLLMRNDEEFIGGYVRWFTDFPARHSIPYTVIFPYDDDMTIITQGAAPPGEPSPPKWAVRGVKQRRSAPYFPSAHYTKTYDADLAYGVLKEKKDATIGVVGKNFISVNFYDYLVKHMPAAKFVDMTEEIDRMKMIKSEEEIDLIRKTAALQDEAIEHVRQTITPGMRDSDVYAEAIYSVVKAGSEQQLILAASGPKGMPVPFAPRPFQNRTIREGDQFSILIEVNGPGGYYAEIARIFSLGPPSQELVDAFGCAVESQEHSLRLMKPGVTPGEILKANNDFLVRGGYKPELRLYAHGQGYDLVERPLFTEKETAAIQPGMNIALHPFAANSTVWAAVCDNYIIGPDGPGECIHKTPKALLVVH